MEAFRERRAPFQRLWSLWALVLPIVASLGVLGGVGVYRYVDNFWLYRGFAPPKDAAWVRQFGRRESLEVTSPALGGRTQQVVFYLPPGYDANPGRRYSVLYLLHGFPGRPLAFLETVRVGVLEDELVAAHAMQPLILVMPSGSTGTFTDKEWANGVRAGDKQLTPAPDRAPEESPALEIRARQ